VNGAPFFCAENQPPSGRRCSCRAQGARYACHGNVSSGHGVGREVIDSIADTLATHDCKPACSMGRRGRILVHREMRMHGSRKRSVAFLPQDHALIQVGHRARKLARVITRASTTGTCSVSYLRSFLIFRRWRGGSFQGSKLTIVDNRCCSGPSPQHS